MDKAETQKRLSDMRYALQHPLPSWDPSKSDVLDLLEELDEYIAQTREPGDLAGEISAITKDLDAAHEIMLSTIREACALRDRIRQNANLSQITLLACENDFIDRTDRARDLMGNAMARIAVIDF